MNPLKLQRHVNTLALELSTQKQCPNAAFKTEITAQIGEKKKIS